MNRATVAGWRATADGVVAALKTVHHVQAWVREIRRLCPGCFNAEIMVRPHADKPEVVLLLETDGDLLYVSRPCRQGHYEFGGWIPLSESRDAEGAAEAAYAAALLVAVNP